MSIIAEDEAHQSEVESDNAQIVRQLKAVVYLLEIMTSQPIGSTVEIIEEQ